MQRKQPIKFKTTMLKSSLCDYSSANICVKGTVKINEAGTDDARRKQGHKRKKQVALKKLCTIY